MNFKVHKAPWGKTLIWVSVLATSLLVVVLVTLSYRSSSDEVRWLARLPLLILPGTALFIIRSYEIKSGSLLIHRLFWFTRVPLHGLASAETRPNIMRGSIRLFGNGGLFAITGWYRNRALGNYRAFVTDLNRTVVLRMGTRTLVVSPEAPERFVAEISQFAGRKI